MTIFKPRCPALHPDLPYSRCGREEGHGLLHRTFTGLEWENTMHPDGRLTWNNRDDAEGGVTAALIEKEVKQLTQQINNQAHNAREDQRVIEEQEREIRELRHALTATTVTSEKAEIALADVHERDETVARLEQRLTEAEEERDQAEAERDDALHSVKVLSGEMKAECHDCIRDTEALQDRMRRAVAMAEEDGCGAYINPQDLAALLDLLAAAEHRATRAEAQSAVRGGAVAIYQPRAREAEAERDMWRHAREQALDKMEIAEDATSHYIERTKQAEARIEAVRALLAHWDTDTIPTDAVIHALNRDGNPAQPCGRGPCCLGHGHDGNCRL